MSISLTVKPAGILPSFEAATSLNFINALGGNVNSSTVVRDLKESKKQLDMLSERVKNMHQTIKNTSIFNFGDDDTYGNIDASVLSVGRTYLRMLEVAFEKIESAKGNINGAITNIGILNKIPSKPATPANENRKKNAQAVIRNYISDAILDVSRCHTNIKEIVESEKSGPAQLLTEVDLKNFDGYRIEAGRRLNYLQDVDSYARKIGLYR